MQSFYIYIQFAYLYVDMTSNHLRFLNV